MVKGLYCGPVATRAIVGSWESGDKLQLLEMTTNTRQVQDRARRLCVIRDQLILDIRLLRSNR